MIAMRCKRTAPMVMISVKNGIVGNSFCRPVNRTVAKFSIKYDTPMAEIRIDVEGEPFLRSG